MRATTRKTGLGADAERAKVRELYKLYGPAINRRCLRILGDSEAGHDAAQEVFVRLIDNVAKLPTREKAIRWLYRVSINHCLHVIRSAARRREDPLLAVQEPRVNGEMDGTVAHRELAQKILSRFDPKTQAVALGVLVGGMEQKEIAGLLGISSANVSRRLRRFSVNSRKYLRRTDGLESMEDAPVPARLARSA